MKKLLLISALMAIASASAITAEEMFPNLSRDKQRILELKSARSRVLGEKSKLETQLVLKKGQLRSSAYELERIGLDPDTGTRVKEYTMQPIDIKLGLDKPEYITALVERVKALRQDENALKDSLQQVNASISDINAELLALGVQQPAQKKGPWMPGPNSGPRPMR